ncbi:MAG TPA: SRPBCC domain-containing protein [Devosia sp.]|nr:SRPBCC domain-containing protein [Devosia sp.]
MVRSSRAAFQPDEVLEIVRVFEAPRELVFKLWLDPAHVVRWYGPEGYFLSHCTLDARAGGAYRYCMSRPDGYQHWIGGTYREIAPPERLSFTYVNDYDGHEMLVELEFRDLGGRTEMHFKQAPFTSVAERDSHGIGWNSTLDLFAAYASRARTAGEPVGAPRGLETVDVVAITKKRKEQLDADIADNR